MSRPFADAGSFFGARASTPSRTLAVALTLLATRTAFAARPLPDSPTIRAVKAFAEKRGLPTREVEAGPSWNKVTRLALPLTVKVWMELVDEIGLRLNPVTGKFEGSLIFRQYNNDVIVIAPPGGGFGARVVESRTAPQFGYLTTPGVIVHLSPEQADHVGRWLTARASDNFLHLKHLNGCSDLMMNIEVEPGTDGTHTLRTISDAEAASVDLGRAADGQQPIPGSGVPMGKTMAEHTGVRASKQGSYMLMKWNWSGNENVQVMLVPVGLTQERRTHLGPARLPNGTWGHRPVTEVVTVTRAFETMSDEQMLGPQHPHGVDSASRRPIAGAARTELLAIEAQLREAHAELHDLSLGQGEILELGELDGKIRELRQRIANTEKSFAARETWRESYHEFFETTTRGLANAERQRDTLLEHRKLHPADPARVAERRSRIATLEAARAEILKRVQP